MARAYSPDLRVRVLDAVDAGLSHRAAALRCRVGIATVTRRLERHIGFLEKERAELDSDIGQAVKASSI